MSNEILRKYNTTKKFKLISSIFIDLIGVTTYLIPGIGEAGDLLWAPISACLIFMLFPHRKKKAISGLVEEGLPFTDFVPTAYLAWRQDYVKEKEKTLYNFVNSRVGEQQIIEKVLTSQNIDINNLLE